MNFIKQTVFQLPENISKLVVDPAVRIATKQAAVDVAQAIKSIGAFVVAVRTA